MKTKILLSVTLSTLLFSYAFAQSNPSTFNMTSGNYSFTSWDSLAAPGTYPPNSMIHIHTAADPAIADEPTGDWVCAYNLTSRSRVLGEGVNGISFINTSNFQDSQARCGNGVNDVGGYVGEFVVALNTTSRNNISVSWVAGLISQGDGAPTPREYKMRLQYRVGTTSAWTDVPGNNAFTSDGQIAGAIENSGPLALPAECNNQPVVQVRWKYYMEALNDGGTRPRIRLDEILISSDTITGIENIANTSFFTVYPNPATGEELYFNKKINAALLSVTGQLIIEVKNADKIDISSVAEGMYFIKTAQGQAVKVLIKK